MVLRELEDGLRRGKGEAEMSMYREWVWGGGSMMKLTLDVQLGRTDWRRDVYELSQFETSSYLCRASVMERTLSPLPLIASHSRGPSCPPLRGRVHYSARSNRERAAAENVESPIQGNPYLATAPLRDSRRSSLAMCASFPNCWLDPHLARCVVGARMLMDNRKTSA